ncbi:MAG: hypothetical protein LW845_16785 [Flammeovirgaceae bacterium]|jgi:hypothetical protein|uniref:Uncharacterized protein n=1 Tax=Microcystis aeruginosa G11-04 TaxID=2685956 RepID=A0A966FZH5_MICAE|nr:hypothetical protein [Flammeovirgaceae bacterium]NCS57238.1 hypothetical protein [Microcystis aeruginosa G11-04]NCT44684.1 hypothetical protein [Microcystis aeruginosa G11-09]
MTQSLTYWQFFIALESDLEVTSRFVEPVTANFAAYSVAFAQLILGAGSEIDVISKLLCDGIDPTSRAKNINDYRQIIHPKFPRYHALEVQVPRYSLTVTPWSEWGCGSNPEWWQAYNGIKHERHNNYALANLKNAVNAVAGLFVAVLYLYHKELRGNQLQPWPKILSLNPSWNSRIRNDLRPGYTLPDFQS